MLGRQKSPQRTYVFRKVRRTDQALVILVLDAKHAAAFARKGRGLIRKKEKWGGGLRCGFQGKDGGFWVGNEHFLRGPRDPSPSW